MYITAGDKGLEFQRILVQIGWWRDGKPTVGQDTNDFPFHRDGGISPIFSGRLDQASDQECRSADREI